jgi:hypothetical protein
VICFYYIYFKIFFFFCLWLAQLKNKTDIYGVKKKGNTEKKQGV